MDTLRTAWKKTPKKIRQVLVLTLGILIVVVGLLLVPLPGPGWLIVFMGLALLATEFKAAERLKTFVEAKLKQAAAKAVQHSKRLRKK